MSMLQVKRWFQKSSPAPVRKVYLRTRELNGYFRYGRFFAVKEICNGLLPARVYREIYRTMQTVKELDCVEIGGAAGAGSICAAQGLIDGGHVGKLIVVEKCEGGSRARYGGKSENLARIEANFLAFDVDRKIRLYPNPITMERRDEVLELIETAELGALILDADGRLDRDFQIFWPLLKPGAPIIVDDYKDAPVYCPRSETMPDGGIKNVLTYRLLNHFVEAGYFELEKVLDGTAFGRKPQAPQSAVEWSHAEEIVEGVRREWQDYLTARGLPLDLKAVQ